MNDIDKLRAEVAALRATVGHMNEAIGLALSQIDELQDDVEELESRATTTSATSKESP